VKDDRVKNRRCPVSSKTFFVQECPTCGRQLQIRVAYLGKGVVCQHCRARFIAFDPASRRYAMPEPTDALLRRIDELLRDTVPIEASLRAPHPR
jgi:hypothetical protein